MSTVGPSRVWKESETFLCLVLCLQNLLTTRTHCCLWLGVAHFMPPMVTTGHSIWSLGTEQSIAGFSSHLGDKKKKIPSHYQLHPFWSLGTFHLVHCWTLTGTYRWRTVCLHDKTKAQRGQVDCLKLQYKLVTVAPNLQPRSVCLATFPRMPFLKLLRVSVNQVSRRKLTETMAQPNIFDLGAINDHPIYPAYRLKLSRLDLPEDGREGPGWEKLSLRKSKTYHCPPTYRPTSCLQDSGTTK